MRYMEPIEIKSENEKEPCFVMRGCSLILRYTKSMMINDARLFCEIVPSVRMVNSGALFVLFSKYDAGI